MQDSILLASGRHDEVCMSGAILIYSRPQGDPLYATVHGVTQNGKRPVIGAGRPVDRQALFQALEASSPQSSWASGHPTTER